MGKVHIRNAIRRYRFEANEMTQQELADKAGVTRQAIISIESGKYSPSLELAFKIARAFGVGVEDLFAWDEQNGQNDHVGGNANGEPNRNQDKGES